MAPVSPTLDAGQHLHPGQDVDVGPNANWWDG